MRTSRSTPLGLTWGAILFGGLVLLAGLDCRPARAGSASKEEVPLTSQMIRIGQKLLTTAVGIGTRGIPHGLVSVNVEKIVVVDLSAVSNPSREIQRLQEQIRRNDERIGNETNPILRSQLKVAKEAMALSKRQVELAEAQNAMQGQKIHFDSEAVLRKPRYRFPDDELVVVVADFSSGNADEGREIADEIAQNLAEVVKATGMRFHVLVGEVKPGVVIRSEQMARDVGKSFDPDTEYAVIWGTMSPRTVGKYRPHLTCCWKRGEQDGVSVSLDLAMEAKDLPLEGEPQERTREAYRRLIGVACAAIPNVDAAHAINRERAPDLSRYYDFLGKDSAEAQALKAEVAPLTRWVTARQAWKEKRKAADADGLMRLRRTSGISVDRPYPKTIYNEKDGSVLALITDPDGHARIFVRKETGEKEVVYIDELEVTNDQFLAFLNSDGPGGGQQTNKVVGGAPWIELDRKHCDIQQIQGRPFELLYPAYGRNPVVMVSWFAARDYCRWSGKEIPTQEEWEQAASRERASRFPWGDDPKKPKDLARWATTQPCGLNRSDRSRIGCFDMQGNVQEWCADVMTSDSECAIRGGGFRHADPKWFDLKFRWHVAQVTHSPCVGFRGVIRLPAE